MARPFHEFGKRRPAAPVPATPVKRSHHVALLVMGTMAVGGGAYALMPRQNCQPGSPAVATPSSPAPTAGCTSRNSVWSGGHSGSSGWWPRSSFYGASASSSPTSNSSGATETTRGGFGGFARAIAAHFSGG